MATAALTVPVSGCDKAKAVLERVTSSEAKDAEPKAAEPKAAAAQPAASDGEATPPKKPDRPEPAGLVAHDDASAVAMLADLCAHAKSGDHAWVEARVKLPLLGNHAINAAGELVHPNDNDKPEDFQYTSYCKMLPPTGTTLRDFELTAASSSGLVEFGKATHRVRFDLTSEPARLVELDVQIEPRPLPVRPAKVRNYMLSAPPQGFTRDEPAGSEALRRKTIALLKADPRCIDDYASRDATAVRFQVVRTVEEGGAATVSVAPFQLVDRSLLACLKTQLTNAAELKGPQSTNAIVELLIPIDASEARGLPTVRMP